MKIFSKLILPAAVFAALLITSAVLVLAAGKEPPVAVLITDGKGYEYAISPSADGGDYIFYLPKTAELSKLTVKYTGRKMLCDSSDDPSLYRGDIAEFDASSGTLTVKEYDSETKKRTTYKVEIMQGGSIGSVYVTLDGGMGALKKINANKSNVESGDVIVLDSAGNTIYDGEMTKMKGHGFTSFTAASTTNVKNSFNFNIAEKTELLYGAGKSKKWVLLTPRMHAGDRDTSGLSQIAAFRTYTGIIGGSRASIEGEYVDLYINGEYRGLYILTERMNEGGSIKVNDLEDYVTNASGNLKTVRDNKKTERDPALNTGLRRYTYDQKAKLDPSDTDYTGGYVLEVMHENYEGCGFETKHGLDIAIKSPEVCTKKMVQYIAAYVQNFENALYSDTGYNSEGKHYSEYADIKSLADTVLVYSFYINFEYFRTSTYIYKDADGEANDILTFGPAWDFETYSNHLAYDETLFGTTNAFVYNVEQQYIWSEQLWRHGDFMTYISEENLKMKDVISDLLGYTSITGTETLTSVTADAAASADMNQSRWGSTNFNDIFGDYIDAVGARYDRWYGELWNTDNYLLGLDTEVTKNEDGTLTLTAKPNGQNDGKVRWFKLNSEDPEDYSPVAVFKDSITVEEDGTLYFYSVTGKNNAYYSGASGEIFSEEDIKMFSGMTAAKYVEPAPEPDTDTDTSEPTDGGEGGCGSALSSALCVIIAVLSAPMLIKRKNKQYC